MKRTKRRNAKSLAAGLAMGFMVLLLAGCSGSNSPGIASPAVLDNDGDGIANDEDNCRFMANPLQEDANDDGVGDACEAGGTGGGVGGLGMGPAPVDLGTAGNYVILAKSGVSTTGTTKVTGDVGLSPAAASFITGFGMTKDAGGTFWTSALVTGKLFAADNTAPTPANLTTAVNNMLTAYTAAGSPAPDATELGAGNIGGLNIPPGVYKWGTGVLIPTNVTLTGGPNDVWIFQISQGLTVSSGAQIILAGGALPENIFWKAYGPVTLNTTVQFKGVILSQTSIAMKNGATLKGRALAQTAVTLIANPVTEP